jgi:BlaI family penicillinase repressor
MARKPSEYPTGAELAILQVLWQNGSGTVRDVQSRLEGAGYTTVLKTLQIMMGKGLVTRDASARAHRYDSAHSEESTQQGILGDLVERAYRGSAGRLVLQALSSKRASREELEEIRRLLDELEEEEA